MLARRTVFAVRQAFQSENAQVDAELTVFMFRPVDAGTFPGHKADSARGVTALSRHAGIIAAGVGHTATGSTAPWALYENGES